MYKLTCKLPDEYREKVEVLKEHFKADTSSTIRKLIDFFLERQRMDRLDKLELRIEEIASRLAFLEEKLRTPTS